MGISKRQDNTTFNAVFHDFNAKLSMLHVCIHTPKKNAEMHAVRLDPGEFGESKSRSILTNWNSAYPVSRLNMLNPIAIWVYRIPHHLAAPTDAKSSTPR